MDELFDKIKDGATKTKDAAGKLAKEVAKRTSNAISSTKLSYSINGAQNKIEDIYSQIGKTIYDKYLEGESDDRFTEEFEKIDALMQDIESLQNKKAELKNSIRCIECETLNSKDAEFCSQCGAKLQNIQTSSDDEDEEVEEIIIEPVEG